MAEGLGPGGDPNPQDDANNPEMSLHSAGNVPTGIQEQTEHVDFPLSLGRPTNTCIVSGQILHRPAVERVQTDCCEEVKVQLKTEFGQFKVEMEGKIQELIVEVGKRELQVKTVELQRDEALSKVKNLQKELDLEKRDKHLCDREHQQELARKKEELQYLEEEVRKLREEKEKLQLCVENLTNRLEEVKNKLDNLENHNCSLQAEMKDLKATLAVNHDNTQCNHQEEIASAIKATEERLLERVVTMLSRLDTREGISLAHLSALGKLGDYKGGSSKSPSPYSVSPASSDHSSKPPTPPPEKDNPDTQAS